MKTLSEIRQHNFQIIADRFTSQRALADALDTTPGYVNQLLTGHRGIGEKAARKIEEKLKLNHLMLDDISALNILASNGNNYRAQVHEYNAEHAPELGMCRKIPVVGMAQLGDNGHWCEIDYPTGHGDGYIGYPSKDDHAYALRCIGDSMKPRIKNGEFVIIEPNTEAISGDEVLVRSIDGRVMVKTLLYKRDGHVYLQSINEAYPSISLSMENISIIHPIVAIVKSVLWNNNQ